MADWFELFLLNERLVGDVTINQQYSNSPKEDRPPPLSLLHPVVKAVVVVQLIRNVHTTHAIVVLVVNGQP